MSATATKPAQNGRAPRLNRDQAAELILKDALTDTPQSEVAIRRTILGPNAKSNRDDVIRGALGVLEARRQAMRVPMKPGQKNLGWVRYTAKKAGEQAAAAGPAEEIRFPYEWGKAVDVKEMFVDEDYQRPLTSFVTKIQGNFNPVLFGTLVISDRGVKNRPHRYAIIDGQTRWTAARRLHIGLVPVIIFKDLTPEDEAEIFALLQKERRGILSYHRFRAAVAAKKPEALAIKKIAEDAGYKLGEDPGQLKAVAALEAVYKIGPDLLERVLAVLREVWSNEAPEADHIRGLSYFYRHYPLNKPKTHRDVDDEILVTRMKAAGKDGLKSKMHAAKAAALDKKGGSNAMWMAHAMQMVYDAKR